MQGESAVSRFSGEERRGEAETKTCKYHQISKSTQLACAIQCNKYFAYYYNTCIKIMLLL